MTAKLLDVALIVAWRARMLEPAAVAMPEVWRGLSAMESIAVDDGFAAIRAVLEGRSLPASHDQLDAVAAPLRDYLTGIAAGIGETGGDPQPMSVVAGLMTGATRLQYQRPGTGGPVRPSAAELATRSALAAADSAIAGEGLAVVSRSAAAAVASWWEPIDPLTSVVEPSVQDEVRLRLLVARLVLALAECAAGSAHGPDTGDVFRAWIGLRLPLDADPDVLRAIDNVSRLTIRQEPDDWRVEIVTDDPGEVLLGVFAAGQPLEVQIRDLGSVD